MYGDHYFLSVKLRLHSLLDWFVALVDKFSFPSMSAHLLKQLALGKDLPVFSALRRLPN